MATQPDVDEENLAAARHKKLQDLVFNGVPVGFFFRYGFFLQAADNDFGLPITVVAFIAGAVLVFPIRPIWQPMIAVTVGIGIAEIATLL
jgi:hypothetical protein